MRQKWLKRIIITGGILAWGVVLPAIMIGVTLYLKPGYIFFDDTADLLRIIPGIVLLLVGIWLSFWAVYSQYTIGEGTPVPLLPPVKLVARGPYRYTRNPMALGVICMLFGAALALWSVPAMAIAMLVSMLHVLYDRFVEERELEKRFGEEYMNYRTQTPFLVPSISLKREKK